MTVHKLYRGDVSIDFDDGAHTYYWQEKGLHIPGVTSVLNRSAKPALMGWAARVAGEEIRRRLVINHSDLTPAMLNEFSFLTDEKAMKTFLAENAGAEIRVSLDELCKMIEVSRTAYSREAKSAAGVGHKVHAYAQKMLLYGAGKGPFPDRPDTSDQRILMGCAAFEEWLADADVQHAEPEKICFSQQHLYAGTCDLLAVIKGRLGVLDFKTTGGVYPEMILQTAAYQCALEEELGEPVNDRWLVRLDKATGGFEARKFEREEADIDAFLWLRAFHGEMGRIEGVLK